MPSDAAWRTTAALLCICAAPPAAAQQRMPVAADLVGVTDITGVQLSPKGDAVLYTTMRADPAADRHHRAVWHMAAVPAEAQSGPEPIGAGLNARLPQWLPGGGFAFVGTDSGTTRLYTLAAPGAVPRVVLEWPTPIFAYAWSPDGSRVAFSTPGEAGAFADQAADGRRGIVVSKWNFIFYQLFGNATFSSVDAPVELWVRDVATGRTVKISGARSAGDFAWSPSSRQLAFTAAPSAGMQVTRTDLLAYSVDGDSVGVLLEGAEADAPGGAISYEQPVWSPDGGQIAFVRSGPGVIAAYSLATGDVSAVTDSRTLDLYRPRITWTAADTLLVEMHVHGQRGLFAIPLADPALRPLLHEAAENAAFSFAAGGTRAAWVRQASNAPPEVYVGEPPFRDARQLTSLNAELGAVWLPPAEAVRWTSEDGVEVNGWLLKPYGYRADQRHPLLTIVHGGPVFAVTNRFQLYPAWEYGGQLLAANGYAVFYPNYRGTGSYGPAFRTPDAVDREPIQDVVTGIRHLVDRGIADPERMGIAGQSYGAWLGPMLVIRGPAFRAASFAEGMVDYISAYTWVPGWHILNSYEPDVGNPYQHTQRYIELSPMFHLASTATPTLIEVGQRSLALQGLQYATALWRHAIPHELVIYPGTGHNISSPALALNSLQRNLDWFDFWILNRRNPAPGDEEQYTRWEAMRAGQGFPPPPLP